MRIRHVAVLALGLPMACNHTDPFPTDPPGPGGPFSPIPPIRLTFNPGQDLAPSWRVTRPGLLYSFQTGQADADICIGLLPEGGGARLGEKCFLGDPNGASRDVLAEPAEGPTGRLAWVETHHPVGLYTPLRTVLRAGAIGRADSGMVIREMPYLAASGLTHSIMSHLAWLGADTLMVIAADLSYTQPPGCPSCPLDTVIVNPEIALFDLSQSPAAETDIPGSVGATSLWPSDDRTALYYTLAADSQVFRQPLAGGAVSVVHNFGAGRVVRDAQVRGNRLWAVVDGAAGGAVDRGGRLTVVDLSNEQETLYPDLGHYFRRPAVTATGTRVAVQAYGVTYPAPDTIIETVADLWLVDR
jgi:hypothetical protein